MRKKLTAVILTAAVAATCLFGACGVTGGGDEVSSEEWKAAFENMSALENYTVKEHYAYSYDEVHDGDNKYTVTRTRQFDDVAYVSTDKVYTVSENKSTVSGVPEEKVTDDLKNYVSTSYYEYYYVQDGTTFYRAEYYTSQDSRENEEAEETEAPEWTAKTVSSLQGVRNPLNDKFYRTEQNGTLYTLSELYKEFTYKDGFYTASLYYNNDNSEISLIIKDGYVIKYMRTSQQKSESKKTQEAIKAVYEFGNFGETEVNPDPKAVEAIEKINASA